MRVVPACPLACPLISHTPRTSAGTIQRYTIGISQFTDQVHPTLGPTTFWGYNPAVPLGGGVQAQKHLGGIVVAQKGQPIQLTFTNNLPATHIIPVDTTIDGANLGDNRTAVHLHGGLVPWTSDGGPHSWFTNGAAKGLSYVDTGISPAPL